MNGTEYKKYHESFMQNNHGSTALHTCLCIYFTLQCSLLCAIKQRRDNINRYVQEYLIIVLPMISIHTFLSDYFYEMNLVIFVLLLYEVLKHRKNLHVLKIFTSNNVFINNRMNSITYLRGLTYLITAFCILAVDFKDFPRHLAKTENYGYSLMDTGVGLFVLISGLVHKDVNKNNYLKIINSNINFVLILVILGIARYLTVTQLDYQKHVTEYGVHWNFFFTLAICKLLSSILLIISSQALILCILVMSFHEILLYNGLQEWVFSNKERIGLIDANREGISSSLGYVALYLYTAYLKKELSKNSITRFHIIQKLLITSVVLLIATTYSNYLWPISRTLANTSYCTYISTVLSFGITILYIFEVLFQYKDTRNMFQIPVMLADINNNGLLYFLLANLTTGAVNLSFRTLLLSPFVTFVILNVYMIFTIGSIVFINNKGIKL